MVDSYCTSAEVKDRMLIGTQEGAAILNLKTEKFTRLKPELISELMISDTE